MQRNIFFTPTIVIFSLWWNKDLLISVYFTIEKPKINVLIGSPPSLHIQFHTLARPHEQNPNVHWDVLSVLSYNHKYYKCTAHLHAQILYIFLGVFPILLCKRTDHKCTSHLHEHILNVIWDAHTMLSCNDTQHKCTAHHYNSINMSFRTCFSFGSVIMLITSTSPWTDSVCLLRIGLPFCL